MPNKNLIKILERGHIYFFYRPKVHAKNEKKSPPIHHIGEVQRFYIVLHNESHPHKSYRLVIIGKKHLPAAQSHEKSWGAIDLVSEHPEEIVNGLKIEKYKTKTRGERINPEARPCGEGVYSISGKGVHHTYLSYKLELPRRKGKVQKELALEKEASYVLSVKNQTIAGTRRGDTAHYPAYLRKKFSNLRFIPANPPQLLNYIGTEILLIGVKKGVHNKAGTKLREQHESIDTSGIINDLRLWKNEHTVKPLLEGKWT